MKRKSEALSFNFSDRSSGILLHLTSLPGGFGSGDLGPDAYRFTEFLKNAGQSWWQMLPVGPPGDAPAFSPYDSGSGFAGSPWLVSPQILVSEGLLTHDDIAPSKKYSGSGVNFPAIKRYREKRLRKAYKAFIVRRGINEPGYREFCLKNAYWLEDFALFMALKHDSGGMPWTKWHEAIRKRRPSALNEARNRLAEEIAFHLFVQYEFDRQWRVLRKKANLNGIGLIGDLPIFAAHDSADVWSHQELFRLDSKGKPRKISGYPPDRYNRNGQRWGHPQYHWPVHQQTGFAWWVQRFTRMFDLFDAVRIDHFLGFTRTWSIPADSPTARNGRWVKSPGYDLLEAVEQKLGPRPMIAEDLGHVTQADIELRRKFKILSTRIFQFGFGNEPDSSDHLPHNYSVQCAAYTGNHDNNTITGWFRKLSPAQKRRVCLYTGGQPETIHWDCLRALQISAANIVIFPLQDILGYSTRARMNVPGTVEGNWSWRFNSVIPETTIERFRGQTELFGRKKSH